MSRKLPQLAEEAPAPVPGGTLIEAVGLSRQFRVGGLLSRQRLHAVTGVNLRLAEGEIVAVVGESGSGKSTLARLLARVCPPTAGEIRFRGEPLAAIRSHAQLLAYRREVQMVFQDPFSSMSPVYPAVHGVMRTLRLHRPELNGGAQREEAARVLELVGLRPASRFRGRYPYQLSGGERQRFGFAQALASGPSLVLADEPVSMLDVSIRAGILNLMVELRESRRLSFLYITHDIASARYVAERMLVMYGGHVVESGPTEEVLAHPRHPYSQLLISAVPDPKAEARPPVAEGGMEPPRVIDPGPGCLFRFRCPHAIDRCAVETPLLRPVNAGREAACHRAEELSAPAGVPASQV